MKISRKDQKVLLYVLGVLMVVAVFFLFYRNKQEDLRALQSEVDTLEAEVRELEEYERNSREYKNDTEEYYKQIEDMTNDFPAEIKEETAIMYARELETKYEMDIKSISMTPSALLSSFGVGERQKHLYNSNLTVSLVGSYENVKKVIEDVQQNEDKRTLTDITLSYDSSTGGLNGQATLNLYSLAGKGQIFEEPDTGSIQHGNQNIFGQ